MLHVVVHDIYAKQFIRALGTRNVTRMHSDVTVQQNQRRYFLFLGTISVDAKLTRVR